MENRSQALEEIKRTMGLLRKKLIDHKETRDIFLGLHSPFKQLEQILERQSKLDTYDPLRFGLLSYYEFSMAKDLLFDDEVNLGDYTSTLILASELNRAFATEKNSDLKEAGKHFKEHRRGGPKKKAKALREALIAFIHDEEEWQEKIPTNNKLIQRLKTQISKGGNELVVEDVIFYRYRVDDEDTFEYRVFDGEPTTLKRKTIMGHMTYIRKIFHAYAMHKEVF